MALKVVIASAAKQSLLPGQWTNPGLLIGILENNREKRGFGGDGYLV
jgi:hypothetical protein